MPTTFIRYVLCLNGMADYGGFMFDGFITTAALTPEIRVADVEFNTEQIVSSLSAAAESGVKIAVLPELCVTGSSCGELFHSTVLLRCAKEAIKKIAHETANLNITFAVGFPYAVDANVYNCAALISNGVVLGIVPQTHTKNHFFTKAPSQTCFVSEPMLSDQPILFGQQVFSCDQCADISLGIVIGDDYSQTHPLADELVSHGVTCVLNLDASCDFAGRNIKRNNLLEAASLRLKCAYLYANAGEGESTGDVVFGGYNAIYNMGETHAIAPAFSDMQSVAQINIATVVHERRCGGFETSNTNKTEFSLELEEEEITGYVDPHPFTSHVDSSQAEYILNIQAHGLAKRMKHVGARNLVLGVSGGLDSTLALIVCIRACRILGLDSTAIHAFSMPGLGTSDRTFNNARAISEGYGTRFDEISIVDACRQHFSDIHHDENDHDVVYENAQARERTQILMDMANAESTFVVGTGDLSELVLGWATYNGDHMSMYGVNASIPKTLVRHLVMHEMNLIDDAKLKAALLDICQTPVSPELLPTDESGHIAQITEDKVGPYVLHDFFIYQTLKAGMTPSQTFKLACKAFASGQGEESLSKEEILHWLKVFYQRLFSQQYKRSCMPDGPQATAVSVSPRGAFMLPSDAVSRIWMNEINQITI